MRQKAITTLQKQLIKTLKKSGALKSEAVERAFMAVPRHLFLPKEPLERAYADAAIVVKRGDEGEWTSSSSQPAIMAIMLEQLDLRPGQRVLEIGTGTGFNAALIGYLVGPEGGRAGGRAGQVTTVDIQADLIDAARRSLDSAGYGWVQAVDGDGGYGYPPNAPYDRIILTVSSEVITPAWREQLVEGGRLVLPFNLGGPQISIAFERRGSELVSISQSDCGFMPLQGAFSTAQPVRTQIGTDSRVSTLSPEALPFESERLAEWLAGYRANPAGAPVVRSGVRIVERELWGLFLWLAVRQEPWAQLMAEGVLVDEDAIPPLVSFSRDEEYRSMLTGMLAAPGGAAVLTRPSSPEASPTSERPFELLILPFGEADPATRRLLEALHGWQRAGKPGSSQMKLRVLPGDAAYQAREGELVLERPRTKRPRTKSPWTKVVVWFTS